MGLALTLALSLGVANAKDAKKGKKKASEKKIVKKDESKPKVAYVSGTNLSSRAGLFFGDTSEVAKVGKWEGSADITYYSPTANWSNVAIPFGFHFGAAENVDVSVGAQLWSLSSPTYVVDVPYIGNVTRGGSSTLFDLMGGAKYRIAGNRETPDFSVGGYLSIPTNGGNVVFTPEGTVTYILTSGLLLNGDMGIHISNGTFVSCDAGVGYPFSDKLTGIAEIGANQYSYQVGGSFLGAGIRAKLDTVKLQALLGVPLNGGGVLIGGGIILASM